MNSKPIYWTQLNLLDADGNPVKATDVTDELATYRTDGYAHGVFFAGDDIAPDAIDWSGFPGQIEDVYVEEIDEDGNVTATLTRDGREIARFDGLQDGDYFEGTISTPTHTNGDWYRGTDPEAAVRGTLTV